MPLTITQLIKLLEDVKKQHGDIIVVQNATHGKNLEIRGVIVLPFVQTGK